MLCNSIQIAFSMQSMQIKQNSVYFLQEYPEISLDDSNTVNGATESIVKLVMSYSSALELLKMLENALKEG